MAQYILGMQRQGNKADSERRQLELFPTIPHSVKLHNKFMSHNNQPLSVFDCKIQAEILHRLKTKIKYIYQITKRYSNFCPSHCQLCEINESFVLIPGEVAIILERAENRKKALISQYFPIRRNKCNYASEGIRCPMLSCKAKCEIYHTRPIDCRSYPVVPRFSLEDNSVECFLADSYCPLTKLSSLLPEGFIKQITNVWNYLAPDLPLEWKAQYNLMNAHSYNGIKIT